MDELVANRTCGDCTVCCQHLTIDCAEMTKLPGVLCRHSGAGGQCAIYEKRPTNCREFFCGWRQSPLPEAWRPDRCEVLLVAGTDVAPDGRQDGVRIHLFGGLDRIFWPPLIAYLRELLQNDIPAFLSVPGPHGHVAARVYLSGSANLRNAFASNDMSRIAAVLSDAVQTCLEHPKEAVSFVHSPK